jgi:hypothetical protein
VIKLIVVARRRAGMSHEEYLRYFEHVHAAKLLKGGTDILKHMSAYVQNHVLDAVCGVEGGLIYDSVSELWFENVQSLQRTMTHPYALATVRPDEKNFSDQSSLIVFMTEEEHISVAAPRNSSIKLMQFIHRYAGMDRNVFVDRWRTASLEMTQCEELSGIVRRYVRSYPVPTAPDAGDAAGSPCDGVDSLWFDRGAHLNGLQAYARWAQRIAMEKGPFIDAERSFSLLVEEVPVYPLRM